MQFIENGQTIIKDVGINVNERNKDNATTFTLDSRVDDLGDLSTYWGIKEIDGTGMIFKMPKDYKTQLEKFNLSPKHFQAKNLKRGDEATFILEKNGQIETVIINGLIVPKQ